MFIARDAQQLADGRRLLDEEGMRVALVPTMGALHDGHLALVEAARRDGSAVVASIFVNPLQFDAASDLARYPVDHARDLAQLEASGCRMVWLPDTDAMYPRGHSTLVDVRGPSEGFEGASRPGHFRGVATVVAMLLGQTRPDTAWFGEKDWQQLQVVRRLAADLWLRTEIRALPTVRESDGLAMSSRNRFLSDDERRRAPLLHRCLRDAASAIAAGEDAASTLAASRRTIAAAGFETDYLSLVDGETLAVLDRAERGARLLAAARIGSVRLLDNVPVSPT